MWKGQASQETGSNVVAPLGRPQCRDEDEPIPAVKCPGVRNSSRVLASVIDATAAFALAQLLKARSRVMSTPAEQAACLRPRSLHVLVVDDEALIRWSLAETLAEEGHRVSEAGDGTTALALLDRAEPFDVVLLDYHLPDSQGLTLLGSIRRLAPEAVVIMMTAFGTPEMVDEALRLGVYNVVSKPFDMHDIAPLVLAAHAARVR